MFHLIDMDTWERREHFQYYTEIIKCGYSLTADLDVTDFLKLIRQKDLKFYPSFVYCVSSVVNRLKEFKMGLSEEGLPVIWDSVHPSYTVFHEDDHTFSDLWTYYSEDFSSFYQAMTEDMNTYGNNKGIKGRPGQPQNFFCISCVPWLSYTGLSTMSAEGSPNLFPIITCGKYHKTHGRYKMPLTVTISHAAADGYHTTLLINQIQEFITKDFTI
ncbi:chloramphenicol acetyltransferase [Anaerostipes sp.]|uniref:chloramphenicol acetyltransferase n=1 Tax=Anaerostipes sp. TaxID=1872530 RepID=UPI0025C57757|nr:chloramphenicol acetyltransferase [Anaerostipes sp.]MBS7007166.1 chloramphenicol acetyltransferase [Anaerostipes sp.]